MLSAIFSRSPNNPRTRRGPRCSVALASLLIAGISTADAGDAFVLSETCPAGFELRDGACYLDSPYRDYPSLQNAGVGGLKTGIAFLREGFTPREIDLGRLLFFDPVLSADKSVACSSCHNPARGFADGLPVSEGVGGREGHRSAPSLWNAALKERLFWDARADSLEEQVQGPLYSEIEMGNTPEGVLAALNGIPEYQRLFAAVYGPGAVDLPEVYRVLVAFEASLISLDSRYDRYAHGDHSALTQAEIDGMNIFRSFVARCAECHTPPAFTNQQIAVIGAPEPPGKTFDPGVAAVTGDPSQRGGFKVPSLRNIALTAPYMHSGRFPTLREAAAFYTGGRGHAVPEGEQLSLHWHIWEPNLAEPELDLIVAFLGALTDESLLPALPKRVPSGLSPINNQYSSSQTSDQRKKSEITP